MYTPVSEFFGKHTFDLSQLKSRLSKSVYQDLEKSVEGKKKISKESLESIAQVIKEWGVSLGATHFCHWFQPLNGQTAEKHDSFIQVQSFELGHTSVIERFTGAQLAQGEPDASSFPSGGVRSTFEARGYTTWDHTSPLFVIEYGASKTLCIPSHFISYNGQALDNKTPLVRSLKILNESACGLLKILGDVDVKQVTATLGIEQEYFLVDRKLASKRPDLLAADRTLYGNHACRGQKLADNYFGSISDRVMRFLEELERVLYKLGVPVKTRHNEVAPNQFEMAPLFETANIASDHNCLAMEVMTKLALEHGFICLLHEKPFEGVNGSGKHCNWSLMNEKGENLLEPGRTPHQNLRFLALLSCVLQAVNKHFEILCAFAANHGNDQRVGKGEAPSRVFSVYLGEVLEQVMATLNSEQLQVQSKKNRNMNFGFIQLGQLALDYSDRNRTSSFAFTGNKFEFRTLGASANVALPMAALNAAVSEAFQDAKEYLSSKIETGIKKDEAVKTFIQETYQKNKRVLYSGDNYASSWEREARKRDIYVAETAIDLYYRMELEQRCAFLAKTGVLTKEELNARRRMLVEKYLKREQIEFVVMARLMKRKAIPALERQINLSATASSFIHSSKSSFSRDQMFIGLLDLSHKILSAYAEIGLIEEHEYESFSYEEAKEKLSEMQMIKKRMIDFLNRSEDWISEEYWKLPTYDDLLSGFKY